MTPAGKLTKQLLVAIPRNCPGVTVWKEQPVKHGRIGNSEGHITSGVVGMADITGILPPGGRRLEIEVKAGKDQMRIMQHAFKAMIEGAGGLYLIARNVPDLLRDLREAL